MLPVHYRCAPLHPTYNATGQGVYDGMFHSYDQDFSDWFTSNSALMVAGNLAVVEANGWSTYYWEIYHGHCQTLIDVHLFARALSR